MRTQNKIIHGKKTDIEVVRNFAEEKGGKLLTTTYKNMLTKMDWQCACGHVFSTTFNHVKNRGQWCPKCGQKKGLENMKKTLKKQSIRRKISCSHQKIKDEDFKGFVAKKNKKKWKKERGSFRYSNEIVYKLKVSIRNRTRSAIKNGQKAGSAVRDLGCSIEDLKKHLESQFQPGMTWDNWSNDGWHIDHIVPLSSFDLTNPDQFKKACHYTNLQPLWSKDNLVKSDKLPDTSGSTDNSKG